MIPSSSLRILFRDKWIIAVDKPAGHLVHPADEPADGDLVTMKILRDQIGEQVHVIHRLDRPTSGVLLFSTDRDVARQLHQAFEGHQVAKTYLAVVDGHPARDRWNCEKPLRKDPGAVERRAETEFRVLSRLQNNLTLIEAKPKTGRFHQIRRHLLHENLPIVGDYRYAGIKRCDALAVDLQIGTRMLLQARSLTFVHPVTDKLTVIEAETDPMISRALAAGGE